MDGDDEGDDSPRNLSEHRSRLTGILVDEFLFTSITGYQDWENSVVISADSLRNPMLFAPQTQSNEVLSQEFRITSPSDRPVEYIARPVLLHTGHDQFDSDLTVGAGAQTGSFPFPRRLCPAPCTAQEGDFVTSAFDQETRKRRRRTVTPTWHISDVWDVTGGLRWSRDEKDVDIAHTNLAHQQHPHKRGHLSAQRRR